jgi:hypothetical protein
MLKYYLLDQSDKNSTIHQPEIVPDQRDTTLARWILYLILIAAVYISVSYAFYLMIAEPLKDTRTMIHQKVISETAPKPVQYRILTYYTVEGIHRLTGMAIWRLDLLLRFLFTTLSCVYLFKFMRRWFDFSASAVGALIIPGLLPVTYIDYIHQPGDMPNLFFTILALIAISRKKEAWLLLLIPVAMLNRESFILVLCVWVFFNYDRLPFKLLLTEFVLLGLIALAVYFALPYYYGPRMNYVETIQLKNNIDPALMYKWITRLLAFSGPLFLAAVIKFRSKPIFLRRSLGYVLVFLCVNFLFAMYQETRLFLPILPVMIPLGLAVIFPAHDPDREPGIDASNKVEPISA